MIRPPIRPIRPLIILIIPPIRPIRPLIRPIRPPIGPITPPIRPIRAPISPIRLQIRPIIPITPPNIHPKIFFFKSTFADPSPPSSLIHVY